MLANFSGLKILAKYLSNCFDPISPGYVFTFLASVRPLF